MKKQPRKEIINLIKLIKQARENGGVAIVFSDRVMVMNHVVSYEFSQTMGCPGFLIQHETFELPTYTLKLQGDPMSVHEV